MFSRRAYQLESHKVASHQHVLSLVMKHSNDGVCMMNIGIKLDGDLHAHVDVVLMTHDNACHVHC